MSLIALVPVLGEILKKVIPDPAARAAAELELARQVSDSSNSELGIRMQAIVAEAKGESYFQRNWRPLTMLVFVGIIFNNYVLAPYVNLLFSVKVPMLELSIEMWELLKLGMGGYVVGRSAEKITTELARAKYGRRIAPDTSNAERN